MTGKKRAGSLAMEAAHLGRRYYDDPARRRVFLIGIVLAASALIGCIAFFADRANTLHQDRRELRAQVRTLTAVLDAAESRGAELQRQLELKTTQLSQLTTSATGKDVVIKGLQDDTVAKQAQIDSLNAQRSSLKGCLDGVTLALVQLTNSADSTARATLDGVRDMCRQAEVLF